jgi:hypothetical protein
MLFIFKIFAAGLATVLAVLLLRTIQISMMPDQVLFSKGVVPAVLPNGLYAGTVAGPRVSWLGKKFNSATKTGINIFSSGQGSTTEQYPFTFSVGKGSHDPISVIRIDYNLRANPLWLRPVLDEIVEIAPDEYLGKLQIRLIPGFPFAATYFRLKR